MMPTSTQLGKGRTVDDHGFAECDDDEEGATLGHVAASSGPPTG